MLEIGRVVRPHGLRGQLVVELWSNRDERLAVGAVVHTADRVLTVRSASRHGAVGGRDRWLVTFDEVADREDADGLRDQVLSAPPLEVDGALWVHELIGATLFDSDGTPVGRVASVEANPASDLLVLEDGRLVPLTFVERNGEGNLTVEGPPGLLEL